MAIAVIVLVVQCSARSDEPDPPPDASPSGGAEDAVDTDAEEPPEPPPCEASPRTAVDLPARDDTWPAAAAVAASFDCVEQVLVVPAGDAALAAVAAPLAAELRAPVLPVPAGEDAEDDRFSGADVRRLADEVPDASSAPGDEADDAEAGDVEAETGGDGDGGAGDVADRGDGTSDGVTQLALTVADELGTTRFVAAAADEPSHLAAAASLALRSQAAVLPLEPAGAAPQLPDGAEVTTVGDLPDVLPDAQRSTSPWQVDADADRAWVVDPATPEAATVVALAALRGDTVVPASRGDLLARSTLERVRDAGLTRDQLLPVGDLALVDDLDRELTLLAEGPLLPGGTLRHFDGTRMVALYGLPGTPALGVLGEQDLDASVDRAREVTAGYDADGRDVIPTFEVIVTVASAEAGDDGNYSRVGPPEQFRELVDRAGEEGFQVILDLQPGRNDFLDQARIYEELLREPHVGLALDPEWRLEPDQVHLRQIGRVEAEEVQRVVDWYADLTRDEGLPQQLLVLHQFRLSMLQDRDTIEVPPELAVAVHADGQGPQDQKLETWRVLTAGAEDRWHWGWKNFYDEDPVVAEPSYVLDLDPEVVLVTFQ